MLIINVRFDQNSSKFLQNQGNVRFISKDQESPKIPGSRHYTFKTLKTFNLYCKWKFGVFPKLSGAFGDSLEVFKNVKSLIPLFLGHPVVVSLVVPIQVMWHFPCLIPSATPLPTLCSSLSVSFSWMLMIFYDSFNSVGEGLKFDEFVQFYCIVWNF